MLYHRHEVSEHFYPKLLRLFLTIGKTELVKTRENIEVKGKERIKLVEKKKDYEVVAFISCLFCVVSTVQVSKYFKK